MEPIFCVDNISLKRVLKTFRQVENLSVAELANELDLSASYVRELESTSSKKKATVDTVNKYANRFLVPSEAIFKMARLEGKSSYQRLLRKVLDMLYPEEGEKNEKDEEK